ncbi:unnamed protein product, partial [Musa textilis]
RSSFRRLSRRRSSGRRSSHDDSSDYSDSGSENRRKRKNGGGDLGVHGQESPKEGCEGRKEAQSKCNVWLLNDSNPFEDSNLTER